jgi:hypothetical protein
MAFSPSSLDFASVAATATASRGVTFAVPASLDSHRIEITGDGFSLAPAPAAAGSQALTVSFQPTQVSSYAGALRAVRVLDGVCVSTCTLAGRGTNPLSIATISQSFGDVLAGASTQRTITVTNAGGADATLSTSGGSFSTPGAYSTVSSGGLSLGVPVAFAPQAVGSQSATLTVTLGSHSVTCALTGTCVALAPPVTAGTAPLSSSVGNSGSSLSGTTATANAAARVEASVGSADANRAFRLEVPHPQTTFNLGYRRGDWIKIDGFGLDTVGDGYLNACGQIGIQAAQDVLVQSTGGNIHSMSTGDNVVNAKGGAYVFGASGVFLATLGDDPVAVNAESLMPEGRGIELAKSQANIATALFNGMDIAVGVGSTGLALADMAATGGWTKLGAWPGILSAFAGFSVSTSGALGALGVQNTIPAPGVTVYGHAGVLLGTPGFGGFYAGAGMVLASAYPMLFGVDPTVLGMKGATVRGLREATLQGKLKASVQSETLVAIDTGVAGSITHKTANFSSEASLKTSLETGASKLEMTPTKIDCQTAGQVTIKVGAQTVVVKLDSVSLKNAVCEVTVSQQGSITMKHTSGTAVTVDASTVLAKDPTGAQLKLANGMAELKNAAGSKLQLGVAGATVNGKIIKLG